MGLVAGGWTAFCLDEVTMMWGSWISATVERAGKNARNDQMAQRMRDMRLDSLLRDPDRRSQPTKGRYADPAAKLTAGG